MGIIFDIQRFCVDDGPGIRTTVFFKGCPLNCLWCHNPESIHAGAEQYSDTGTRIGCERTAEEVLRAVLRGREYFMASGGGITLSGGEPLMQVAFAEEVLSLARQMKLHTCVETCGFVSREALCRILPLTGLFLYDIKLTPQLHRKYTGQDNGLILDNLDFLYRSGAKIRLRCPIIPSINDTDRHFSFLASLAHKYPRISDIEIMPYHNMGVSKARRLGIPDPFCRDNPSQQQIREWRQTLKKKIDEHSSESLI